MGTIQVRNLPEETIRMWKVRAARSGQSLQEYMRAYLTAEADKPTVEELVERLEKRHRTDLPDLPLEITLEGIDETWE
jgi:plasmid stability protein